MKITLRRLLVATHLLLLFFRLAAVCRRIYLQMVLSMMCIPGDWSMKMRRREDANRVADEEVTIVVLCVVYLLHRAEEMLNVWHGRRNEKMKLASGCATVYGHSEHHSSHNAVPGSRISWRESGGEERSKSVLR